ncbi:MAG: phospholipase D family protein [Gammaproteobacteria bacterium]
MNNQAKLTALLALAFLLLSGCASVPLDLPKPESSAFVDTENTALAQSSKRWRAPDATRSGFYPLLGGLDAFGARLALMDRAERSIDAKYFLMKPDSAGLVFAGKLLEAANRGVRVRLLLDDIFTTVDDKALIVLDMHPNIELRIFNPISRQGFYFFNYLGFFDRVNRRMHNKSFTVDNQVSIVGGRNIAEEYFELKERQHFFDFDVLSAGPVVRKVSDAFDRYWNHRLAVPMEVLSGNITEREAKALRQQLNQKMQSQGETVYAQAIDTSLMRDFYDSNLVPYLADARVVIDQPQKLLEEIAPDQQVVATAVADAIRRAEEEVLIITPYFIPGTTAVELIRSAVKRGVQVTLVTNSLASNNHTVVHSAYSSYRKTMLEAGVQLWEARAYDAEAGDRGGSKKLTQVTLHTKLILIDRRYLFAGSLNLDPRSIEINTELGMMIESSTLSDYLARLLLARVPERAYRLKLDQNDKINWHATIDSQQVIETREPQTSLWRRFKAWFLKITPEKQL